MKNRKPCKLNILLFIILILAGSILFVMLENPEATTNIVSVGGVTKEYNLWIGYDAESKDHGAKVSLQVDSYWLCCAQGSPLPGWTGSMNTSDTVRSANTDGYIMSDISDYGSYVHINFDKMDPDALDFEVFATIAHGEEPSNWGFHTYRELEGAGGCGFGFTESEYTFITFGDYSSVGSYPATPMEAYILAQNDPSYKNRSVRLAWWQTPAGGGSRRTVMMKRELQLQLEHFKIMLYQLQDQLAL